MSCSDRLLHEPNFTRVINIYRIYPTVRNVACLLPVILLVHHFTISHTRCGNPLTEERKRESHVPTAFPTTSSLHTFSDLTSGRLRILSPAMRRVDGDVEENCRHPEQHEATHLARTNTVLYLQFLARFVIAPLSPVCPFLQHVFVLRQGTQMPPNFLPDLFMRHTRYTEHPNKMNGSSGRSYIQASKVWKIISPQAERDCAYKAVVLCLAKKDHEKLLEQPALLTRRAIDLKYRVNPEHKAYANDEDLQLIANYKKVPIVLYNNVYEKVKVFEPCGKIHKRSDRMLKKGALEIELEANHYYAMLRRTIIGEPYAPEVEPVPVDGAHELIKTRNILKPYDDKFVAWDLECTGNGTDDGVHKCYASGFAWGAEYRSFWGLDAIRQSLDFLYDNREAFDGYTFYAHNGGSYDMTFMFREGLLEDTRFKVENCVEQNSSYIHVKMFVGDCAIVFHDSLRILPAGLAKLCKEFKVKHQKLTETVNHEDITVDNYRSFSSCLNTLKTFVRVSTRYYKQTRDETPQL